MVQPTALRDGESINPGPACSGQVIQRSSETSAICHILQAWLLQYSNEHLLFEELDPFLHEQLARQWPPELSHLLDQTKQRNAKTHSPWYVVFQASIQMRSIKCLYTEHQPLSIPLDPRFWVHSDGLLRAYTGAEPISSGLFDNNRPENRGFVNRYIQVVPGLYLVVLFGSFILVDGLK